MAKVIRVVSLGPALSVKGGVSRVIGMIKDHLPNYIRFRVVATCTRYTGTEGANSSDRGSRLVQALIYLWALVQIPVFAVYPRTVFHVHLSWKGSMLRKGLICVVLRILRCRYLVHVHSADTDPFQPWLPQSFRRTLLWGIRGAARVIVLTQFCCDHFPSIFELPTSRMLLLRNPADLPNSIPDRIFRQELKLVFLGRIGVHKGAFDVIRAFAGLPNDVRQGCGLVLAGDGDVDAAEKLCAQLGCSSQVSVLGWIGAAEVGRLLSESDVFLLPSHAEAMSMALIEGMGWGLAVIATAVGAHGEFLESGYNSILVDPGDVHGIAAAIYRLSQDRSFRLRLGLNARNTARRFSIDSYILSLDRLYEQVARNSSCLADEATAG